MSYISGPGRLGIKPLNSECGVPEQQAVRVDQVSGTNNLLEFYDIAGNLLSFVDNTGAFGGGAGLAGAVILLPTTSARNVIQPSGAAVIPLISKGFAGQTADLQEWQDSAGTVLAKVDASGNVTATSFIGDNTALVTKSPATTARNLITPTADVVPLSVAGFGAGTADLIEMTDANGHLCFKVGASGQPTVDKLTALTLSTTDVMMLNHNSTGTPAGGFGSRALFKLASDTTQNREAADFTVIWATAADATRKARLSVNVWDTAARECIRCEASGTAPLLGFFGATAVAQIAGSTDILAGMVSLGFRAASSNPPLNMGTGKLTCGSVQESFTSQSAAYPITSADSYVFMDATGGSRTATLPTAVGIAGQTFTVKKTDASANNVVLATTGGQTIDGAASLTWNTQYQSYTVVSDGANWGII